MTPDLDVAKVYVSVMGVREILKEWTDTRILKLALKLSSRGVALNSFAIS